MNRFMEMVAFTAIVDQGGFTAAAAKMGISKSAVSKHVTVLEARLGARLLNRTTRRVSPTEIGLAYYDRARMVIVGADEADAMVADLQAEPKGVLRIAVTTDFGASVLSSHLSAFLRAYPEVAINLVLCNRYVELIKEQFDISIQVGALEDSTLMARRFTTTTFRLVGSPDYFSLHGRPEKIDDLGQHELLCFVSASNHSMWSLTAPSGEIRKVHVSGRLAVNDSQSLLQAAIDGHGIAYLPEFLFADALEQGQLVEAIPNLPRVSTSVFALHAPGKQTVPKVRAFVDFLVEAFKD